MFNVDNIIVPTDFSDYSDLAFQKALDLAEACNAKIYLVHVVADSPDIFKLDCGHRSPAAQNSFSCLHGFFKA